MIVHRTFRVYAQNLIVTKDDLRSFEPTTFRYNCRLNGHTGLICYGVDMKLKGKWVHDAMYDAA